MNEDIDERARSTLQTSDAAFPITGAYEYYDHSFYRNENANPFRPRTAISGYHDGRGPLGSYLDHPQEDTAVEHLAPDLEYRRERSRSRSPVRDYPSRLEPDWDQQWVHDRYRHRDGHHGVTMRPQVLGRTDLGWKTLHPDVRRLTGS